MLFLIPISIVQMTKLVQFTRIFSKIPPSASVHSATRVRTWRAANLATDWAVY
jgi:hypothetical protein